MNPHLGPDATEFGEVAAKAFAAAGGVDLARRAEADPALRNIEIGPLLEQLGIGELDAADADSAEAAAALCRAAGAVVLPYPVVPAVLAGAGEPLALASRRDERRIPTPDGSTSRVDHAGVFDRWRLATVDGGAALASPAGDEMHTQLGPFVGGVEHTGSAEVTSTEIALHLSLTGFVVAGALASAVELATAHVVEREQFGQPLSKFQAVQFQLADAHVAVAGVEELVQFALWRCHSAPAAALPDALAARLAAVEAARLVLRTTQQLHGASGLCDEYDISVIVRHLQPALRIPFGADTTASLLADAIDQFGFAGLFDHGGSTT